MHHQPTDMATDDCSDTFSKRWLFLGKRGCSVFPPASRRKLLSLHTTWAARDGQTGDHRSGASGYMCEGHVQDVWVPVLKEAVVQADDLHS